MSSGLWPQIKNRLIASHQAPNSAWSEKAAEAFARTNQELVNIKTFKNSQSSQHAVLLANVRKERGPQNIARLLSAVTIIHRPAKAQV